MDTRKLARISVVFLLLVVILAACQTKPQTVFTLSVKEATDGNNLGFVVVACPLEKLPEGSTWDLSMRPELNSKWGNILVENAGLLENQLYISQGYRHYYDDIFDVPEEWWTDASSEGAGCRQASLPDVLQATDTWNTPGVSACPVRQLTFKLFVTMYDEHGTPYTSAPAFATWACPLTGSASAAGQG